MTVTPLGDQAALVELADEPAAVALAAAHAVEAPLAALAGAVGIRP